MQAVLSRGSGYRQVVDVAAAGSGHRWVVCGGIHVDASVHSAMQLRFQFLRPVWWFPVLVFAFVVPAGG